MLIERKFQDLNIFEKGNMKIFKFILDLIAPKKCYSCKKE
jgi:hypothetical protein